MRLASPKLFRDEPRERQNVSYFKLMPNCAACFSIKNSHFPQHVSKHAGDTTGRCGTPPPKTHSRPASGTARGTEPLCVSGHRPNNYGTLRLRSVQSPSSSREPPGTGQDPAVAETVCTTPREPRTPPRRPQWQRARSPWTEAQGTGLTGSAGSSQD